MIILVNWRRALDTLACVASLDRLTHTDWTVVICENGSGDDSASMLRNSLQRQGGEIRLPCVEPGTTTFGYAGKECTPPRYILVVSEKNRGFAGGNNLSYRLAKTVRHFDCVWFLNSDTEVEPDSLSLMLERLARDPLIGICGSTLVYAHDHKTVQALGGGVYRSWLGLVSELGQGMAWPQSIDQAALERQMSYVSGASMLTTSEFLDRVGLMSEDYFLYYEEIDWAVRARYAGFRLGYASGAVVYHKEGSALGSGKSNRRSALAEYYGLRNKLVITRRYFPWAIPTVIVVAWLQVVRRIQQGQWARARLMAGVLLGLRRSAPGAQ